MVGTLEEAVTTRKSFNQELSQIDRDIIGETCRLEIPFRDVIKMRKAADLLRGFAEQLDFYSRRTDIPPRSILFHLRSEAKGLNKKLRELKGAGRPRKEDVDK